MLASIRDDRETLTRQFQGKLSNLCSLGHFSTQRIVVRMGVQSCRFQVRVTDDFFSDASEVGGSSGIEVAGKFALRQSLRS